MTNPVAGSIGNPDPAPNVIDPFRNCPVERDTWPTFDTVLSSVLTSAIQYRNPWVDVAEIVPAVTDVGSEPSLIHCRVGYPVSFVIVLIAVGQGLG